MIQPGDQEAEQLLSPTAESGCPTAFLYSPYWEMGLGVCNISCVPAFHHPISYLGRGSTVWRRDL